MNIQIILHNCLPFQAFDCIPLLLTLPFRFLLNIHLNMQYINEHMKVTEYILSCEYAIIFLRELFTIPIYYAEVKILFHDGAFEIVLP